MQDGSRRQFMESCLSLGILGLGSTFLSLVTGCKQKVKAVSPPKGDQRHKVETKAQIDAVKQALESRLRCDPYPLLKAGKEVLIKHGPLKGRHGTLLRKNGDCRVLLSIPLIGQSIAVEMAPGDIAPL